MDVAPEPVGSEPEPEEKPKRGFAAWTPEEREAARVKAAETRARNKEEKSTPTARLEAAEPRVVPKQPKGAKVAKVLTTIDREVLVKAMEMTNVALDFTSKAEERWPDGPMKGQSYYSLSREEIEKLADAWFEVAKRYPVFGSFLVAGRTFSVWGDALFVSYVVVGRRVQIANEFRLRRTGVGQPGPAPAGPARPPSGNDGLGKDDFSAADALSN